jgi:hypothetical protein
VLCGLPQLVWSTSALTNGDGKFPLADLLALLVEMTTIF